LLPSPVFKRVNVTTGWPPISGVLLSFLGADCAEEVIVITKSVAKVDGKARSVWMYMATPRKQRI
jgi:p-aminobenzoyl-glutamate transporter AbgT